MAETVEVAISDLLLDQDNARLGQSQASQQDVYTELTRQQGRRLLQLADDIVRNGLDPTTLVGVVPTGDRRKRYKVVEGNRRVLALKALETPAILSHALSPADQRRLSKMSQRYLAKPLDAVACVLFEDEDESRHWIELRHTGANDGAGLVTWDPNEQDRFRERHTGSRKPAGQILDFVEKHGALSDEAKRAPRKVLTNLERLFDSPTARRALGVDVVDGQVVATYPLQEVAKSLTHVVDDFKCGRANVHNVYLADDRDQYLASIPKRSLPKGRKLQAPVKLVDLAAGLNTPVAAKAPRRRRAAQKQAERTAVIPNDCTLNIAPPRINKIYNELLTLSPELYPNACAVLLRVFLELSVDHALESAKVLTEAQRRNQPLASRLKSLAKHFRANALISEQLEKAVIVIADRSGGPIAASTMTMNQYVHNPYVHPTSSELRAAWDQMQPFIEKVWP